MFKGNRNVVSGLLKLSDNSLKSLTDPTPWWPQNNQMPQGQNYPQMQFGGNMPYPGSNLPPYPVQGVTVDMNATPQTYANMYGGGPMTLNVGNPGGAVPNYNQGMSMRQTMLKETKQNTPGYSLFNNATWNPNLTATGGNDAGGDMDRELSTVADALEKLLGKSWIIIFPFLSGFCGPVLFFYFVVFVGIWIL